MLARCLPLQGLRAQLPPHLRARPLNVIVYRFDIPAVSLSSEEGWEICCWPARVACRLAMRRRPSTRKLALHTALTPPCLSRVSPPQYDIPPAQLPPPAQALTIMQ